MGRRLKVTKETLSPDEVRFSVEVPAERVETAMDAAYRRLVKRYKIPGFRPGRAPRSIFERHVGRDVLRDEASDALLPTVYDEALKEAEIAPFENGRLEEVKNLDDGGVAFTFRVYKKPEITLPDLATIEVTDEPGIDVDDMVERYILDMRRSEGALIPEETATENSALTVSGEVRTEGEDKPEPFKDLDLHLDEALVAVRAGLLGAKVGEDRTVTYVQDGKRRETRFHIDNVARVELPELDDDFARSVGYKDLKDMRERLTNYVSTSEERRRQEARAEKVLGVILAGAQVPSPDFLVEREVEHQREHHDARAKSEDEVRAQARESVRRMLVADALIEKEGIQVSSEELQRAAVGLMKERGDTRPLSEDEIRTLARVLLDQKLTAFLAGLGKTEGSASGEAAQSAPTSSEKGAGTE